ncbi:MAG TPA: 50S ribosomal protein L9 [Pyrinomonadaceae bacterium]|nr:50S ribosomal protein L9 [Pyrinomonadaceae bacterium]
MATTTILLREDIDNLGGRGEIVKVKSGYARNFLLPKGLALLATKGNVKQVEQERAALLKKAAHDRETAQAQAEQMSDITLTFERKAGDGGQLFGSVTSMDIANALQAKGYEIDRRKINLRDVIKETGEHTVPVRLHREVTLEVPVIVRAEGSAPEKTQTPQAEETAAETATATEETTEEMTEETAAE